MAPRKRRKPADETAPMSAFDASGVVQIPEEPEPEDTSIKVDATTGTVTIENDDGSITIDPTGETLWQAPEDTDESHEANLANKIDPTELGRIAEELFDAIESDKQDRSQWEQMRAKCIELLGIKLEDPKGDVSRSALGMATSVVKDPTMLQAVNLFRANTYSELCPASGPVKVKISSNLQPQITQSDADELQADLNTYLTTTACRTYRGSIPTPCW